MFTTIESEGVKSSYDSTILIWTQNQLTDHLNCRLIHILFDPKIFNLVSHQIINKHTKQDLKRN